MQFVTVWEVIEAIASSVEISEVEITKSLRLDEEVIRGLSPSAPSPFVGLSMGDLRAQVVANLARSFARAHKISRSAAVLENVLHHAHQSVPAIFDLRQTGLPRLSASALSELQPVLIGVAQFERRLVEVLSAGKFRNFPSHGGPHGVGISPDDWTSHPSDYDVVNQLVFRAEDIQLVIDANRIPLGRPLRDVFTKVVITAASHTDADPRPSQAAAGARATSPVNVADFELVPIERRAEGDDREEVSAPLPRPGRTPKKYTDEFLAQLIQRNKNGEPWQKIADELRMKKETLENVHVGPFRRKLNSKHGQQPPTDAFGQLATGLTKQKAQTK